MVLQDLEKTPFPPFDYSEDHWDICMVLLEVGVKMGEAGRMRLRTSVGTLSVPVPLCGLI